MNDNVLVATNKNDNSVHVSFVFCDIPDEEVKLYGDVVIALHNRSFNVEIDGKLYSSESSETICIYIQLLKKAAIAFEVCRDNNGKSFLRLARIENNELLYFTIVDEASKDYKSFFRQSFAEDIKELVKKHIANPEYIPVGRYI